MTAQSELKAALRDVLGPAARQHGYQGSAPTWRKSSGAGDWAVINIQSSKWSTSDEVECVLALGFAPAPWLRYRLKDMGAHTPKSVSADLGLYQSRLHPKGTPEGGTDGWWKVFDEQSAQRAATDMVTQLEHLGWPSLQSMFAPGALLARLRADDLGMMKRRNTEVLFACAEALLLMDAGPSPALDAALSRASEHRAPRQRDNEDGFDAWVRAEAAKGQSDTRLNA